MLGLTTLGCGGVGLLVGGRSADRLHARGVSDAPLRIGLLSLAGLLLTLAPALLLRDVDWTIALLIPAVLCIGLPIGCSYAAIQLIFPNQMRGRVSAVVIMAVALFSLAFGATLPGVLNDHWFRDGLRIGQSLSLTVALAAVTGILATLATFAPHRADLRALHRGCESAPPVQPLPPRSRMPTRAQM